MRHVPPPHPNPQYQYSYSLPKVRPSWELHPFALIDHCSKGTRTMPVLYHQLPAFEFLSSEHLISHNQCNSRTCWQAFQWVDSYMYGLAWACLGRAGILLSKPKPGLDQVNCIGWLFLSSKVGKCRKTMGRECGTGGGAKCSILLQ